MAGGIMRIDPQLLEERENRETYCRRRYGTNWALSYPKNWMNQLYDFKNQKHILLQACNDLQKKRDGSEHSALCCYNTSNTGEFEGRQKKIKQKIREQMEADGLFLNKLDYTKTIPSYWPDIHDPMYQSFVRDFFLGKADGAREHNWSTDLFFMSNAIKNSCPRTESKAAGEMMVYQAVLNLHMKKIFATAQKTGRFPTRGVLVSHSTGSGKTLSGVQTADAMQQAYGKRQGRRIIIASSPDSVRRYESYVEDCVKQFYRFPHTAIVVSRRGTTTTTTNTTTTTTTSSAAAAASSSSSSSSSSNVVSVTPVLGTEYVNGYPHVFARKRLLLTLTDASGKEYTQVVYAKPLKNKRAIDVLNGDLSKLSLHDVLAYKDSEFPNDLKHTEVIRWLKESGLPPGIDYVEASGPRAYRDSAFLSFATIQNSFEREDPNERIDLNNCVFILDECQGLVQLPKNWAEQTLNFYKLLDHPTAIQDTFIVLMSATPGDTLDEMVRLIRLTHLRQNEASRATADMFLPLNETNLANFSMFCYGQVSYVDLMFDKSRVPENMFESKKDRVPFIVEKPVSEAHAATYWKKITDAEKERLNKSEYDSSSKFSFMQRARKLSNVPDPERHPDEHIEDYSSSNMLAQYSTKLYELWKFLTCKSTIGSVRAEPTSRHLIYVPLSSVVGGTREVIAMLTNMIEEGMQYPKFVKYNFDDPSKNALKTGQEYFVHYEGDLTQLQVFNGPDPRGAEPNPMCRIVVTGGDFVKMYTLYALNFLELFGSPTSMADYVQLLGRGARLCSHRALDFPSAWNIHVVVFLSMIPSAAAPKRRNILSTNARVTELVSNIKLSKSSALGARSGAAPSAAEPQPSRAEDISWMFSNSSEDVDETYVLDKDLLALRESRPDAYVLTDMLTRDNMMQAYVDALQQASIDCRLMSVFHKVDENAFCIGTDYVHPPKWRLRFQKHQAQKVKQIMEETAKTQVVLDVVHKLVETDRVKFRRNMFTIVQHSSSDLLGKMQEIVDRRFKVIVGATANATAGSFMTVLDNVLRKYSRSDVQVALRRPANAAQNNNNNNNNIRAQQSYSTFSGNGVQIDTAGRRAQYISETNRNNKQFR